MPGTEARDLIWDYRWRALHSCSEISAVERGECHMGNVGQHAPQLVSTASTSLNPIT